MYTKNSIPFLRSSLIYKAKLGHIYDPENKQYDCFRPANDGRYSILDCWVCDENGNVHPGYNVSPVPVSCAVIGRAVKVVQE